MVYVKDSRKFANCYNGIDDMTKDDGKNGGNKLYSAQILTSENKQCEKNVRQTIYFNHDMFKSDLEDSREAENFEDPRTISNESTEDSPQVKNFPINLETNSNTKTIFLEESINNFLDPFEENSTAVEQIDQIPNTNSSNINPSIKTLFFNNEISVENLTMEIEVNNQECGTINRSFGGNLPAIVKNKNNYNSTYTKTYFDNIMPVEEKSNFRQKENIQIDENLSINIPAKPLNSGKFSLLHQLNKSKLCSKLGNNLITPKKSIEGKINSSIFATPRLSLLEFTSLEKMINEEETETTYKRSSFTLTPEFSATTKKRKSLVVHNWEESKCLGMELINKSFAKNDAMEISVVIPNESSFPMSYINISKNTDAMEMSDNLSNDSVISIQINKPFSLVEKSSNNDNNLNAKLELDPEHMAESIHLIRSTGICRRTGTVNMPASSQKYNEIGEKIEHIQLSERNLESKHYDETFRDEDSFNIPKLPPTPHMRLSFLEKLLERQTIVDDIIFWGRDSLDCKAPMSYYGTRLVSNLDEEAKYKNYAVIKAIEKYEANILSFEMNLLKIKHKMPSESRLPFVLRLNALLRNSSANWICDYQMQYRGKLLFTHKMTVTLVISLSFEEIDHFGHNVSLQSVKLEKSTLPKRNWKPFDFFLEFQLKLNLPYNFIWLVKGGNEVNVFKMLKKIDQMCLKTLKIGKNFLRICYTNQASIVRDGGKTCVHKIVRQIVNGPNNDFKYVKKTAINIELLNIKTLSYKDILIPRLHHFQEKIHLLPTGLQFLQDFLPDPLNYLKVV